MRRNLYKHTLLVLGVLFSWVYSANAQIFGDNLGNHKATIDLNMQGNKIINAQGLIVGNSIFLNNTSVALQIDASDKALLISRVFDTNKIAAPENGMIIYSNSDDKFYTRQAGVWAVFGSNSGGVTTLNGR